METELTEYEAEIRERPGRLEVRLRRRGPPLTYREVVSAWLREERFRSFFSDLLAEVRYRAYFFEVRPVDDQTFDRAFEFVVVESQALAKISPDPRPFSEHFIPSERATTIATFESLGRDAMLVAPRPDDSEGYPHLAAFLRTAPSETRHALWRAVASAVEDRLGGAPLWLSTSGLGVYWLHVRLDSRPKYYTHAPYRTRPA